MTALPDLLDLDVPCQPAPASTPADAYVSSQIDHLTRFLEALGRPRNHPEVAILGIAREALASAERYAIQAAAARRKHNRAAAVRLNKLVHRLLWLAESRAEAVSIYRSHY